VTPGTLSLEPAHLAFDGHGVPRSERYGDVYHSSAGGLGQCRHVFLAGNGLPERWRGRDAFTVLETGFGLGLNFLATWQALRDDATAPRRLHFVSVEKHPFARDDLERAHAAWPELAPLARELCAAWPPLVAGFHRLHLDAGRATLTLLLGDATASLPQLEARVDAIFLDGFAPDRNPEMWSEALCVELARLAAPGATAATWTVAAAVRSNLERAGFATAKRPGFGGKRDMLVATRTGGTGAEETRRARRAIVVGAGLAGTWCAERLAARGWSVDLVERHAAPAREASGNRGGVLRPALNLPDNENARCTRAAFLYAAGMRAHAAGGTGQRCGVLHVATTPAEAARMARIAERHAFPPEYVRLVERPEAARLAGHPVAGPGWWFPLGAWADPVAVCEAGLARAGDRLTRRFGRDAARLERCAGGWRLSDRDGHAIAEAGVVVLANALEAPALLASARAADDEAAFAPAPLPLVCVRGQITHLPEAPSRRLEIAVCGDGYVAPMPGGGLCAGATFQPEDADGAPRVADHAENLARIERLLPGFARDLSASMLDGRVAHRTATPDRLPVYGRADDGGRSANGAGTDGVYVAAGLGARGLIWAPLGAELLASMLEGEPLPLERDLVRAISPARFG